MEVTITDVKIRATISGAGFSVSTPYILSFYIRKSRNELSSFNFSVKVGSSFLSGATGGPVTFEVSANGVPKKIYTGIILAINVRPCFDDPQYVIVDASGTDIRKELEYKQYTRRSMDSTSSWAMITGVVRQGLKSSKLNYSARSNLGGSFAVSPDTLKRGGVQNTSMTKDYLHQNSSNTTGIKNKFGDVEAYGYVVSAPTV